MRSSKIIVILYSIFAAYLSLLTMFTNFGFQNLIISYLVLAFLALVFIFGHSAKKKLKIKSINSSRIQVYNLNSKQKIALSAFIFIAAHIFVEYYTGNGLIDIIGSITNGRSIYNDYQRFFIENNINQFSIQKIPYILIGSVHKLIVFYSLIELTNKNLKVTHKNILFYFSLILSYLYIGFGRGTSFEIFEVILLLTYIILSREIKINMKITRYLVLLIIMGMFRFTSAIDSRNFSTDFSVGENRIYYDSTMFISTLFPNLSKLLFRFYGYFGFGFSYISSFISNVVFQNFQSVLLSLLSSSSNIILGLPVSIVMDKFIDVGVKWRPDFVRYIDLFGIFGFFIIIYILGWISSSIEKSTTNNSDVLKLLNFFIVLQMFSLPIGNFVLTSSSSKIMLFILLIYAVLGPPRFKKVIV